MIKAAAIGIGNRATALFGDEQCCGEVMWGDTQDGTTASIDKLVFHGIGDIAEKAVGQVDTGIELVSEQASQAEGSTVAGEKAALEACEVDKFGGGREDEFRGPGRDGHGPGHGFEVVVF